MSTAIGGSRRRRVASLGVALLATPLAAHASLFSGDTLDAVANGVAWVALVIAPIVGIVVFWLLHILPEKIAEKKNHPQTAAIQTLCLLSLFFGGLLWPIAWLWAYTKPVAYKAAYGHDEVDFKTGTPIVRDASGKVASPAGGSPELSSSAQKPKPPAVSEMVAAMEAEREIERLKRELAEAQRRLGAKGTEA